jgi:hypothetical protein
MYFIETAFQGTTMAGMNELAGDWRDMKAKLEKQLATLEVAALDEHGPLREKLKIWIAELDELIVKYAFPI